LAQVKFLSKSFENSLEFFILPPTERKDTTMTVGTIVQGKPVFAIQRAATVYDAALYLAEKNIGAVAVLDGTQLVGILSERDIIKRVMVKNLNPKEVKVDEVMTKELIVATADENEESCLKKMKAANCRHLPIVSGNTLIGVVSLRDLLQIELSERDEKLEFLNNYLFHLPPDAEQRTNV
jgi:CBS domain-containing protein